MNGPAGARSTVESAPLGATAGGRRLVGVSTSSGWDAAGDDAEVVDGVPVDSERRAVPLSSPAPARPLRPAAPVRASATGTAQTAAVALTGFAAGAVTAAVVRGASRRRAVKAAKRAPAPVLPVLGSRSFLVDVHLLGPRD